MRARRAWSTRLFTALLAALAPLAATTAVNGAAGGATFPCTSTTIRSGALLPDLVPDQQLLENDHFVWHDPQTGQFLLAFSAGIKNLGAGTLNAVGFRAPVGGNLPNPNTMPAFQRIFHADGSCDEVPIGTLTYHPLHHHWHLNGMMSYQLFDASGNLVKPNSKVAFCLADVKKADPQLPGFPTNPVYNGCDPDPGTTFVSMGTSVGWEDIYDKRLEGQNFDVTDLMKLPNAQYFIQQTVNEAGVVHEESTANDTTGIWVTLGNMVPFSTGLPRPGV
jgi:lysyl oxidase